METLRAMTTQQQDRCFEGKLRLRICCHGAIFQADVLRQESFLRLKAYGNIQARDTPHALYILNQELIHFGRTLPVSESGNKKKASVIHESEESEDNTYIY
jgi:hypothetical protein